VSRARRFAKKLVYGFRGRFPYFGHTVYFPTGSHIFERACEVGVYEREVVDLILALVEPETTYFDVGTNIGLLSVPVLAVCPSVKVVSIEASPDTLPYLRRTRLEAQTSSNWTIVETAVGAQPGEAEFWSAGGAMGAFDGLRDTGRGGAKQPVRVAVRTLDDIWRECGCPPVSVIKMDIEGGEYHALQGARELITKVKPALVIEWAAANLATYKIAYEMLLSLCAEISYVPCAYTDLVPICTKKQLQVAMRRTETFVLASDDRQVSR